MSTILKEVVDLIGFRAFATISKDNIASLNSAKAVRKVRVVKELSNNYVLVEYD